MVQYCGKENRYCSLVNYRLVSSRKSTTSRGRIEQRDRTIDKCKEENMSERPH
jgi:hypothetical protein